MDDKKQKKDGIPPEKSSASPCTSILLRCLMIFFFYHVQWFLCVTFFMCILKLCKVFFLSKEDRKQVQQSKIRFILDECKLTSKFLLLINNVDVFLSQGQRQIIAAN